MPRTAEIKVTIREDGGGRVLTGIKTVPHFITKVEELP